jgi:SAM-dependent methyltransferase
MTYEGAGLRLSSPDRTDGTSEGPVFPGVSVKSPKASPSSPEADASMLHAAYRLFWARVGRGFPDLGQAASTRFYVENERRLFREHFPPLPGLKIFKTDLWDEARNTRILVWASERGALPFGVDISPPTAALARAAFSAGRLRCAVSDVRELPFADASFDAIYSMGTIEHFDETEQAIREMARVLKPDGRAIVGVPNRHDPFLRPLLSTVLQWLGLYAYGFEKSYSRKSLRRMIEAAGLTVVAETAILFIPGWLRMLDLACHSWCRPLTRITAALVWPFVFLDQHVPAVRRHGYLLATVVTKGNQPPEPVLCRRGRQARFA